MRRTIGALSLLTLTFAACSDSNDPGAGPPANVLIQSGGGQQFGVFGQAVPIAPTVLVTDASNRPVSGARVTFLITSGGGTLSSPVQTTNATGTASVTWTVGNTFGPAVLTATVAGLPPVTFTATVRAPVDGVLAFNLIDPAGDTLTTPAPGRPRGIDILSLRGDFKSDSLILTATFSTPVTFGSSAPNSLVGFLEFDIDDNASTGAAPVSNSFGASANIRVEYVLSFFSANGTQVSISSQTSGAPVAATFSGNTVVARIPMNLLGNDDGNFTIVGVIGTVDRPTDVFPNTGQTTVRRAVGIGAAMHVGEVGLRRVAPTDGAASWRSAAVRLF